MLIVLHPAQGSAALEHPDAFDRFAVAVVGEASGEDLAAVVRRSGLGRVHPDGDHVVVDPGALRRLAGAAATPSWEAGFEGMCAYAAGKGWVEADGGLRAHIERRGGPV
jgi:hypothetical protein